MKRNLYKTIREWRLVYSRPVSIFINQVTGGLIARPKMAPNLMRGALSVVFKKGADNRHPCAGNIIVIVATAAHS
jgi:hypothetical protein